MKILRALFYQYYWWHKKSNGEGFLSCMALLSLLLPFFGIIGFLWIFVDVAEWNDSIIMKGDRL